MKKLIFNLKIDFPLENQLLKEVEQIESMLKCIVYVVLFIWKRSLGLTGGVEHIADSRNSNFYGLLELLVRFCLC